MKKPREWWVVATPSVPVEVADTKYQARILRTEANRRGWVNLAIIRVREVPKSSPKAKKAKKVTR